LNEKDFRNNSYYNKKTYSKSTRKRRRKIGLVSFFNAEILWLQNKDGVDCVEKKKITAEHFQKLVFQTTRAEGNTYPKERIFIKEIFLGDR